MISIRPFRPGDLAPVVALWNSCLTYDPISEERFWRLLLLDPNFDPAGALVAESEGVVVGFMQAIGRCSALGSHASESELGWLTVFFVASEWRRRGIGTRLLETALSFLRNGGCKRISCNGYSPYYIFPGVDEAYADAHAFLQARGFAPSADAVAMGMALDGVKMPDAVRARYAELQENHDLQVRPFRRADTLPLLAFAETHFPHYASCLRDGLRAGSEDIIVATWAGEVVACTQWQNTQTDPPYGAAGRYGPFGVRPDLRSRGIGAIVFYTLVEHVAAQNARYLWFGWAGGRNVAFYERAGCRITRRFRLYQRALDE